MRVKHWFGYGCVNMKKIKDKYHTLHVRVSGNHECGVVRDKMFDYDLYSWFVKRFDKTVPEYLEWKRTVSYIDVIPGWDAEKKMETCDYIFDYKKGE